MSIYLYLSQFVNYPSQVLCPGCFYYMIWWSDLNVSWKYLQQWDVSCCDRHKQDINREAQMSNRLSTSYMRFRFESNSTDFCDSDLSNFKLVNIWYYEILKFMISSGLGIQILNFKLVKYLTSTEKHRCRIAFLRFRFA